MTPPASRYGPLHALVAGAVLVYAAIPNGLAAFWQQFLHGIDIQFLNEQIIVSALKRQFLFSGGLFLALWASTIYDMAAAARQPREGERLRGPPPNRSSRDNIRYVFLSAIPICVVAIGLNWASGEILSRLMDVDLSDQDLVKFLTSNTLSLRGKSLLFSFLVIEAPLLEELLFRGVLFGGLTKIMPVWGAMLLSGFLFAIIHVNAATLIPLWFLGVAFAWLYVRTKTLLAPIAVHLVFNATNLLLLLFTEAS